MKIIDQDIIKEIIENNKSYDDILAGMTTDEAVLVIHPNLPNSVLEHIDWDIEHGNFAVRWNSGRGWIAKKFPPNWNNKFVVINVNIPILNVEVHPLAEDFYHCMDKFTPEGWNLNYKHVWLFKDDAEAGRFFPGVTITYLKTAVDTLAVDKITVNSIFDVFFLSYDEPNAEENFQRLLQKRPDAQRIHGVKGIYNAHQEAAKKSKTDMFYVVDGDAFIADSYNFDFPVLVSDRNKTYIWNSYNPVTKIEYGYGGVKLFSKNKFESDLSSTLDVSTAIGPVEVVPKISCETRFDTTAFHAWKSSFREVVKLGSGRIKNQIPEETNLRLKFWLDPKGESPYLSYCKEGALAGIKFLEENFSDLKKLQQINDFDWLKEQFNEHYK